MFVVFNRKIEPTFVTRKQVLVLILNFPHVRRSLTGTYLGNSFTQIISTFSLEIASTDKIVEMYRNSQRACWHKYR